MVEEQAERETAMVKGPKPEGRWRILQGSVPSCGAEATVSKPSSWVGGLGKEAKETGNLGVAAAVVGGGGGARRLREFCKK